MQTYNYRRVITVRTNAKRRLIPQNTTILSRQAYSEKNDCKAEFFTEGKIFEKNNEVFVEYDETELSGFMGGHTILTIRDNEIIMSRANCESGAKDTRMEFMKDAVDRKSVV